jgi:ubiquinone/menaquinone biosynthesis C-methylase UbiE
MVPTTGAGGASGDWRSYDQVAADYERVHAPRTAQIGADLVTVAGVLPGERVLDIGTGTGVVAEAARQGAGDDTLVVGVDASLPMLLEARRARPSLRLAAAQAIDLPFRDARFDVVTAAFVLTHFTKYDTALHDILRVLTRGGRLAVSVWGEREDEFQRTWREQVEQVATKELLRGAMARAMPWEDRFRDPKRLEETLREAGLRPVRVERRQYRFEMSLEDYVISREVAASGRFLRDMLGPRMWDSFRDRVRALFRERFPDPLVDFRDVLLAVGTKPVS